MSQADDSEELDALFGLLPAEFVPARNALAAQRKKAGDKVAAARIKALTRPAPAAWALNQLHFQERHVLDDALAEAQRVRRLHGEGGAAPEALKSALAAQRASVAVVVDRAQRLCDEAGLPSGLSHQRKLLATVQGWLAGVGDEPPGRMTHGLQAGGFAGVDLVAAASGGDAPVGLVPAPPAPAAVEPAVDPREVAEARLVVERRERLAQQAREAYRAAQREQASAHTALEQLTHQLEDAERLLAKLREKRERQQRAALQTDRHLASAEGARAEAEGALEEARRKLGYLEG